MTPKALILIEGSTMGNGLLYVQAARRLGLHPITLAVDPAQYDYLATESAVAIQVDTTDFNALKNLCCRLQITHGIAGITSALESVYATVGRLCDHFGLPGPNALSIMQCCNKFLQRETLKEADLPIPAFRLAANATEVESAAAEIGLPVILKPAEGSGSCGVQLCRDMDELVEHTTYMLGGAYIWRSSPRILVEEFAQGPHYTALLMGNEVIAIATADFGRPPHFVYREFTCPAPLTYDEHKRIADLSLSCLQALGLGWGPTAIELRWTERGPIVIEVNPRLSGTPDPQLVKLAYGIDLVTEHIKLAIGGQGDLRKKHSQSSAARFLVPESDGILDSIEGVSTAAAVPGVAEVKIYAQSNTPFMRKGDYRDCLGYVVVASPCRSHSAVLLQEAIDQIHWSITPF
ncbi:MULTISPECIES: ATP-grasp domain-containing protein [Rhizobium]|uniref:ATP-grasp domain-containing protein n=1 Tax=Rhizobium TaxID=379 RepID=UPI001C82B31D|nr:MULTISPECIES: acetyl-CoA carboxylase biotin carboxylase subunit family protein [Rhizobium]MBX4917496.1 ATP-grasp domain-containing protein [Rhizobium bangladeshense]MBY5701059.1 ATP-grasp domain-containing protein [Rhizobium leguminosarum]